MVSGIGKRTGHSTLKNAKEKASLPTIPLPLYNATIQDYNTNTSITASGKATALAGSTVDYEHNS